MIVGTSGKAGSGKDTFCDVAVEEFGAIRISFAGGLKEEVAEFLTFHSISFEPRNLYGTQEDKEEVFFFPTSENANGDDQTGFLKVCGRYDAKRGGWYVTFRALLQWWGTEYRRAQDDQYWIKKALAKCSDNTKTYVISDCRFKNEAQAIIDADGILVRVNRPNGIDISNMAHASEIDLDDWDNWDCIIENTGTLEEYKEVCHAIMTVVRKAEMEEIEDGSI